LHACRITTTSRRRLCLVTGATPDPEGKRILTTFDQVTFNECVVALAQLAIGGHVCEGLGVNNSIVASTTNIPVPPGNATSFSFNGFRACSASRVKPTRSTRRS
jgi:hypothetical protein